MENLGHTLFNIILWETREVYLHTTSLETGVEESVPSEVDDHIQNTLSLRTTLLKILESWMDLNGVDAPESRQLQCVAFRLIADLRKLFPLKEANYLLVDQLAWHPSEVHHPFTPRSKSSSGTVQQTWKGVLCRGGSNS